MSDKDSHSSNHDDQFARMLQKQHERIGKSQSDSDVDSIADEVQQRLQAVEPVLDLLQEVKEIRVADSEIPADTRIDPSSKDAIIRPKSDDGPTPTLPQLEKIGRFKIVEQIGRGGFGTVVRAFDPKLQRDVAIKIPRLEAALSPEARARFERESKAAAALDHPNIVSVFETGTDSGVDFIVTQLIDGDDLATLVARGQKFSPVEAAELVAKTADAIEHAHQRGVLHRDIKPSNILIEQTASESAKGEIPEPLVTDFGLASMLDDEQDFTQSGTALGTPEFMSPEQARGKRDQISVQTDVHGLGAMLYKLLTGRPPCSGKSVIETLRAIAEKDPPAPRSIDPSIPRDLEAICLKCLEKKPSDRYSSARELQADLRRFINGTPVTARQITVVDRGTRWVKRNSVLSSVLGVLAVVVIGGLITTTALWLRSENMRRKSDLSKQLAEQRLLDHELAIDKIYDSIQQMPEIENPELESVRQEMLANVNSLYSELVKEAPTNTELKRKKIESLLKLVNLKSRLADDSGALEIASELLTPGTDGEPNSQLSVQQRIDALLASALAHMKKKEYDEGTKNYETALQLARHQYQEQDSPTDADRIEMATTLSDAADLVGRFGNRTLSTELAMEAIDIWEGSQAEWIDSDEAYLALSRSLLIAAQAHSSSEKKTRGRILVKAAIDMIESSLAEETLSLPEVQYDLSEAYRVRSWLFIDHPDECNRLIDSGTQIILRVISDHPKVAKYRALLFRFEYYRGLTIFISARDATNKRPILERALKKFEQNVSDAKKVMESFPNDPDRILRAATNSITMAGHSAFSGIGDPEKRLESLQLALKLNQNAYNKSKSQADLVLLLGNHGNIAAHYAANDQLQKAIEKYEFTTAELKKILETDKQAGKVERFLSANLDNLGFCYSKTDQPQKALASLRLAMAHTKYMNPKTMKDKEAFYLLQAGEWDAAQDVFQTFAEHQESSGVHNKTVVSACNIIVWLEELESDQPEAKEMRQLVVDSAIKALDSLAEKDKPALELFLNNPRLQPLKRTSEFAAWQAKR